MIVEPASALPVIFGVVEFEGDAGLVPSDDGGAGAKVSLVKSTSAEQSEVLSAASVAVTLQLLVELVAAVTARHGEAKAALVPVATAVPLQVVPL